MCTLDLRLGFGYSPRIEQVKTVPVMCGRIIRIQLDSSLKFSVAFRKVPIEKKEHPGQRGMRFGERVIEGDRQRGRRQQRQEGLEITSQRDVGGRAQARSGVFRGG